MLTLKQHIRLDPQGTAWVGNTRYKVKYLIEETIAYGWSPEEIVHQHYGDLTLAQVHAALSFYYDNRQEIDSALSQDSEEYQRLREANLNSPLRQKLRAKGLIS